MLGKTATAVVIFIFILILAFNRKRNPYIGGNVAMKGGISGGFMENIAQRSMERTRPSQNAETEIIRTVKYEKSNRPPRESENANGVSVISSKHGDPTRKHERNWNSLITSSPLRKHHVIGGGTKESAPMTSNSSFYSEPLCTFDVPYRPVDKIRHQTVNKWNTHSPTICTTDIDTVYIGDKEASLKENLRVQQMDGTRVNLCQLKKRGAQLLSTVRPSAHERMQIGEKNSIAM
nr:hypothetical protein HmN_000873200 [Hymenolepis microstoma]